MLRSKTLSIKLLSVKIWKISYLTQSWTHCPRRSKKCASSSLTNGKTWRLVVSAVELKLPIADNLVVESGLLFFFVHVHLLFCITDISLHKKLQSGLPGCGISRAFVTFTYFLKRVGVGNPTLKSLNSRNSLEEKGISPAVSRRRRQLHSFASE